MQDVTTVRTCLTCGVEFTFVRKASAPGSPPGFCSDDCRRERAAIARRRAAPDIPDIPCEICGVVFSPRNRRGRTCSVECSLQWRRKLSLDGWHRRKQPRPPRPDVECESCQAQVTPPKTGPTPRWCTPCRAAQEDRRARKRVAGRVRVCHKCQIPVPDAAGKAGLTVCDDCRTDPRKTRTAVEKRRRLRKYGLTQEEYDALLIAQVGRCPGCGTDDPGVKGWCIDHCHSSGRVRGVLCFRCNLILGQADESPATLRALANFLEQSQLQPSIPSD